MHNLQQSLNYNYVLPDIICCGKNRRIDTFGCQDKSSKDDLYHECQKFYRNQLFYQHIQISLLFFNLLNILLQNLNLGKLMSIDKMKQIEKNLAEQESFVQSIIEQREKKSRIQNNLNADNILSSSIQKAKQKINLIDYKAQPPKHDRSSDNLTTSRQKKQRNSQQGSAIAAAMKKLQQRISNLEQQNIRLQSQNKQIKKRETNQIQKNESLRRTVQENKRKIKNIQSSIENDKKWIKQLQKKNEQLQKQVINRKINNVSDELQKKLTTSEMMYRAQQQQFKNLISENQTKQRKVMQLQNKRKQQEIRFTQQIKIINSLNRQLQLKIASYEQKNKQKDILIQNLKNQIKNMDAERLKYSTMIINNSRYENTENQFYGEKHMLESRASRKKALETEMIRENQLQQLRQKYDELFLTYKNLDQKNRQQKLQTKNYRNKFWQLKQSVKQLIDKIQTLPNGVTSQLKYLIVKINKIETYSTEYFAATPTKSARKNSFMNSSTQRSKSNSKKKSIKIDLNRSNNSAKSKKSSSHTNRSTQSKKKISVKEKQVIISQKQIKKTQITELESEIKQIRKRYKQLVMAQNKASQQVSEDIREELNNLAMLLQQRSQQLTRLKRKK